ncbi:hypothetical protein CIY_26810 [Butyrivibrio fibrisolvens 16/4]|nr:hypothetical protein CIY_26810 [Butyrivibrio fibrisolvens 16/4]
MVLDSLEEVQEKIDPKTRKAHIIKDILSTNERVGELEKRRRKVKEIFKGYKSVSSNMKSELEGMGFNLKEEGKHIKLTYHDDSRYMTTIAKTPSDGRTGNNVASNILREMM